MLVLVTGRHFNVTCKQCFKKFTAGSGVETQRGIEFTADRVFADTTGEAFKAYYCEGCVNRLHLDRVPKFCESGSDCQCGDSHRGNTQ